MILAILAIQPASADPPGVPPLCEVTAPQTCIQAVCDKTPGNEDGCVLDECTEVSGAGIGYVDISDFGQFEANGTWLNGCGGAGHDDQASGNWWDEGAQVGGWYVNEDGHNAEGQRVTTCQITGNGAPDQGVHFVGMVGVGDGGADGNCNGSFTDANPASYTFTFGLHIPQLD
jgi:hypothetical protein